MFSQGSVDLDYLGYDGGSSGLDSEGFNDIFGEKVFFILWILFGLVFLQFLFLGFFGFFLFDFWFIVWVLQDCVEVYVYVWSLIWEDGGLGIECCYLQQFLVR